MTSHSCLYTIPYAVKGEVVGSGVSSDLLVVQERLSRKRLGHEFLHLWLVTQQPSSVKE